LFVARCPECGFKISTDQLKLMAKTGSCININEMEMNELLFLRCPKCGREGSFELVRGEINNAPAEEVYEKYRMAKESLEIAGFEKSKIPIMAQNWILTHYGVKGIPITRRYIKEVVEEREQLIRGEGQ